MPFGIMATSSSLLKILEKVPLKTIFHAGFIVSTGTILLCYTLATTLGHVPDWLPMISDCAVYAPEKYPFRWGIMLGAVLIAVQSVLVYGADKPYSKSKTALNLALFSSFCLSVVAVVNEVEDIKIHGACAMSFFLTYEVYMVEVTWILPQYDRERRPSNLAYLLRQFCVLIATIALAIFVYLSSDWGKNKLYIAICEWTATFTILIFNWSFAADFSTYFVEEIDSTSSSEQKLLPVVYVTQ